MENTEEPKSIQNISGKRKKKKIKKLPNKIKWERFFNRNPNFKRYTIIIIGCVIATIIILTILFIILYDTPLVIICK